MNLEDSDMKEYTDYIDELRKAAYPARMESTSGSLSSSEATEDTQMELERFSGPEGELQDIEKMLQIEPWVTEIPERNPFPGAPIRLVDYSNSEGDF